MITSCVNWLLPAWVLANFIVEPAAVVSFLSFPSASAGNREGRGVNTPQFGEAFKSEKEKELNELKSKFLLKLLSI